MLPLRQMAEDIRVFTVRNNSLQKVLVAKKAQYRNDFWHIEEADVIIKPATLNFDSLGIRVDKERNLNILEGFRPKMLDQVYEGKVNFTIKNAIDAVLLLGDQNIDTSTIKGALYKIFIYPFFVPSLVVIIFFFVPVSVRFLNVSLFSFAAILATLMIWGILFMLIELSNNKTLPSEIGVIMPIIVLFLIAIKQYVGHRTSSP